MFALFSRILKLSDHYKSRIQGAFVCAFLESILSKMPIFPVSYTHLYFPIRQPSRNTPTSMESSNTFP